MKFLRFSVGLLLVNPFLGLAFACAKDTEHPTAIYRPSGPEETADNLDSDGDGIADANDQCPNFDDNACINGDCGGGSCNCNDGWQGDACDMCAPDYFGENCTQCLCPLGTCEDGINGSGACASCMPGFAGEACDICNVGHFGSDCQPCTCVHGTCNEGKDGDGQCAMCESGWTGPNCDEADTGPDGDLTITANTDLSMVNRQGRTCTDGGDMVSYAVSNLTTSTVTLSKAPAAGCLNPNDEVILIHLQGQPGATESVGKYELLRVQSVSVSVVTLAKEMTQSFGTNIGIGLSQQRVMLQRVPNYKSLTVQAGATATAAAWNVNLGTGGVFAARVAGSATINGSIDMDAKGYAGGAANDIESILGARSDGQQGESIAGSGTKATAANVGGGGGGLGDPMETGVTQFCLDNGRSGAGGGHVAAGASAGATPAVTMCRMTGDPSMCPAVASIRADGGASYGAASGLFLGSGGGSGGADNTLSNDPPGGAGGAGGGIILLMAESLTGAGTISTSGGAGAGDAAGFECPCSPNQTFIDYCYDFVGAGGGGAGGSVFIEAMQRTGFTGTTTASGGPGGNANDDAAGDGGNGGDGRVAMMP